MKLRICGILLIAAGTAAAANVSGKWELASAGGRAGRGGPTVLNLLQAGGEVTGTISVRIDAGTNSPVNAEVWAGKVEGDTVTFYVWTGTDQPSKTSYSGKISPSGDEIVFTVTGGRGGVGGFGGFGGTGGQGQGRGAGRGQANAAPAPAAAPGGPQQITAKRVK